MTQPEHFPVCDGRAMRTRAGTAGAWWRAAWLLWAALLACACQPAKAPPAGEAEFLAGCGIEYRLEVKDRPRALRIHQLRIDLRGPRIELAAALADDPDGDGPAEAALEKPESLADRHDALAMVNANAFAGLAEARGRRSTRWHAGMAVDVIGLAASGGRVRSPAQAQYVAFWLDGQGQPRLGQPDEGAAVREGVAGFGWLVREGRNVCGRDEALHPRTAIGLDAEGRWLHLVVVDGRQAGYSEGMTTFELAEHMLSLSCVSAANLDGGGSSVMVLAGRDGARRVANDPSTKDLAGASITRPIPTALLVRAR